MLNFAKYFLCTDCDYAIFILHFVNVLYQHLLICIC